MKIHKASAVCALLAAMTILAGCGGADPNSPEELAKSTIENFYKCFLACDFDGAKALATAADEEALTAFASVLKGETAKKMRELHKATVMEVVEIKIEDGTNAVARLKMTSSAKNGEKVEREQTERAVLVDGKWKVSFKK